MYMYISDSSNLFHESDIYIKYILKYIHVSKYMTYKIINRVLF